MLGLDILCACDASVDLTHHTLCLAEEEVLLWSPGVGPWPSSLIVAKDHVIPAQYKGIVMARLKRPLGVEVGPRPPGDTGNGLECYLSGPKAHKWIPSITL